MDNREFNVAGRTKEQLRKTLKCLLLDEYSEFQKVKSWGFDKEKGLVLYWSENINNSFKMMGDLSPEQLTETVWQWLQTDEAKTTTLSGSDINYDHDGHNEIGFRVYKDGWSEVEGHHYSICAITPRYCWYGK